MGFRPALKPPLAAASKPTSCGRKPTESEMLDWMQRGAPWDGRAAGTMLGRRVSGVDGDRRSCRRPRRQWLRWMELYSCTLMQSPALARSTSGCGSIRVACLQAAERLPPGRRARGLKNRGSRRGRRPPLRAGVVGQPAAQRLWRSAPPPSYGASRRRMGADRDWPVGRGAVLGQGAQVVALLGRRPAAAPSCRRPARSPRRPADTGSRRWSRRARRRMRVSSSKCSEIPITWLLRQPESGNDGSISQFSPCMVKLCGFRWPPVRVRTCTSSPA